MKKKNIKRSGGNPQVDFWKMTDLDLMAWARIWIWKIDPWICQEKAVQQSTVVTTEGKKKNEDYQRVRRRCKTGKGT
jgi:hypothetical protein